MDAVESEFRWRHWTVRGPAGAITEMVARLDAGLPTGWKRLTAADLLPFEALVRPGSACYALSAPPASLGVTLTMERLGESELRGSWVWFDRRPSPTPDIPAAWDQVMRFLDDGVIPAARETGVNLQLPTRVEGFFADLFVDVGERLRTFSQAAPKRLPLGRDDADRWRDFVIAAFRTTTVIDDKLFADWLVAEGWPPDAAAELVLRFADQCLLLSRFADEASAA